MKLPFCLITATLAALIASGCATAPRLTTITGQILVSDAGQIQKTGLAPIWIYDATNAQLTAKIPLPNFGGLDCHEYVFDWLKALFTGRRVPRKKGRIAYIRENGDGPWGDCEWVPPIKPGQAYF